MENGSDVPSDITAKRQNLRDTSNSVEQEINALTSKAKVITYDYPNIN
jgi:hypothetical protein